MAFQISPGVNVSEVDLTTVVPSVSTTAGAFVGDFQWGPAEKRTLVTTENELASVFGQPSANTSAASGVANTGVSFFSAANFLAYGNNLQVVRAVGSSTINSTTGNTAILLKNEDSYDNGFTANSYHGTFGARYAGALGNSLKVSVCTANATNGFASWTYKSNFAGAPSTTPFVSSYGGANDQIHIAVIDEDGLFTGTKDTVLEAFAYVSQAPDAVYDDGTPAYWKTVIRNNSKYIYALNNTAAFSANTDVAASAGTVYTPAFGTTTSSMTLGASSAAVAANVQTGLDLFSNKDEIDISLIVTGDGLDTTTQNYATNIAKTRMDCVAFVSPLQGQVVGQSASAATTAVAAWAASLTGTNYAFADSGWKYQYDKYNNMYRWIPLNGDMAGLCVRTDDNTDPWFSPAGYSRGAVKNVVKLAWNPNQAQRDTIYSAAVNPVISLPGQGTLLFGDKTLTTQPSAFSRINVRRLFIVLEKAISNASKFSLFELNDEFTRAQFVALVEPFLRDIKGRRGIYDYRVVCDTTNNTQQVIDSNRFVGDIYIKPARSINYIQLNFIAVRSGVQFSEIVGGA
jgi:phage tail sheath protein FI